MPVMTMEKSNPKINLDDITIREELNPGDLGYVIYLHGKLYSEEYSFGIPFESYVAAGLHEFFSRYDPDKDRVWVCEHRETICGFLLLMHREENAAQLRYFILHPEYRGLGLGKKLMKRFMDFLKVKGYRSSFLWTTHELGAAASLYKRYGFTLAEERDSTLFGRPLKEQRYELYLE